MRRYFAAIALALSALAAAAPPYDPVVPGYAMQFPADAGAHPGHRIEWWYVTGQLESAHGPLGFQVTFFRVRNAGAEGRESRFAPTQLVFAHAALSDPAHGRLRHDQRSARAGFGLVEARRAMTDVFIDDWSLRAEDGGYRARIPGEGFTLELVLRANQPVLLQGERGFSRKGPALAHASYYYSEPQLGVTGTVAFGGKSVAVTGTAWLDHEWSSEPLAEGASGWDWVGANLDDGTAVMAYRIRAKDGSTLWGSATVRPKGGAPVYYDASAIRFEPRRAWKSPRTGITYPVAVDLAVGERRWSLTPMMDDQELDARSSTGTVYWEGAMRLSGPGGAGRGYLELAGYDGKVPF